MSSTIAEPRQSGSRTARRAAGHVRPTALHATPPGPRTGERREDDWPHTTRLLPWLVALFIAMLWLVPFNSIQLTVSLPFDLHLDRIILPFIFLAWLFVWATGGRDAPRIHVTVIHGAAGVFLGLALLSVVVNADSLARTFEFNSSIKSLSLLTSYLAMFLVIASVVRRSEVAAFMKYTLVLAVICGLGVLWEYRFGYNVFYSLSNKLFKAPFEVAVAQTSGVDEIGRRLTLGPAELALELAGMLSMALPIALVGVIDATRRRTQVLYGVALCILLAADVATFRKTSLVAPAIIVVGLAVFRPRAIVRLVPYLVVLFILVHVLSPGALGGVIEQFSGSRLSSVNTVLHRADAFDAVRPMIWSHLLFGLGYGGYDAFTNRILDDQILGSAIEVGVLGVLAYVGMMVSTVGAAIPMIRGRDRQVSSDALAAALAAVGFLTLSFLYDAMAFPHGPYIFLTMAAFVAVLATPRADPHASAAPT